MHNQEFENIAEYLTYSYEEGFVGTLYSLQQQGIPLVFPINQEQVAEAIQHDTKISTKKNTKTGKLYASMGEDITDLKKKIAGEISRGFAGSMSYAKIAANMALISGIPKNNAMRIARTEMHRIQTKASMDTCYKARKKGADIVKMWDSTLDSRTKRNQLPFLERIEKLRHSLGRPSRSDFVHFRSYGECENSRTGRFAGFSFNDNIVVNNQSVLT